MRLASPRHKVCLVKVVNQLSHDYLSATFSVLKWPPAMQIYCNNQRLYLTTIIQLLQDCFERSTWPQFHCLGTPIQLPWYHKKTLYTTPYTRRVGFICHMESFNIILVYSGIPISQDSRRNTNFFEKSGVKLQCLTDQSQRHRQVHGNEGSRNPLSYILTFFSLFRMFWPSLTPAYQVVGQYLWPMKLAFQTTIVLIILKAIASAKWVSITNILRLTTRAF